jgi:hypothetical protein
MNKTKTAVLVSSCDAYQEVWEPFFTLFFRYWPDCPFPVYLIANHISYPDERVSTILVGQDRGWGSQMRLALERLSETHIIYFQEDFLLERRVDTARIIRLLNYMEKRQAGCLRLYPCPGPDLPSIDNEEVGEISRFASYRVALQAAIWHKPVLQALLVDGESAWKMEGQGSERSRALEVPFLSVKRHPVTDLVADPAIPYYCTAIVRGRWVQGAVELCNREGIRGVGRKLPIETACQQWWRESRIRPWVMTGLWPAFWLRRQLLRIWDLTLNYF